MTSVIYILIQALLILILAIVIYYIFSNFQSSKIYIKFKNVILDIKKRKKYLFRNKIKLNMLNEKIGSIVIILISIILCIIAYSLIFSVIRIPIASIIFSISFLVLPYGILKLGIMSNKNKIKRSLPIYITNLKSQVKTENNILLAIKRTKPPCVLQKHIDKFVLNINMGIDEYKALDILNDDVGVEEFSKIILAIKVCQLNGGNFEKILQTFFNQITWKIEKEENFKEKSFSNILTLAIMICINIFVLIVYVLGNAKTASIMLNSFIGRMIIDLDSISCVACIYMTIKMYNV